MNNIDAGLGLLHIATGAFFVTSGARKCFLPDVRAKVCDLITSKGTPLALAHVVIAGEFLGGLGLLTGTLTHLAAFGLLIIMLGAYVTDTWPSVREKQDAWWPVWMKLPPKPDRLTNWSHLASNAMCTPEFQLIVILATLVMTGAGAISLDHFIF